ncbi:hypothetical protein ACHAXS_012166 [Conticribra weissflogii]
MYVSSMVPLILLFISKSLALDIDAMKQNIQKEIDTIRPFSTDAFIDLWANQTDIEICVQEGCFQGMEGVKHVCDEYSKIGPTSMTCDVGEDFSQCHFLHNKAACVYSCNAILVDNPRCVSESLEGICVYEWNEDGLLVRFSDYFVTNKEISDSLTQCVETEILRASRTRDSLSEANQSVVNDHKSSPIYFLMSLGLMVSIGVAIGVNKKKGYTKIEENNRSFRLFMP